MKLKALPVRWVVLILATLVPIGSGVAINRYMRSEVQNFLYARASERVEDISDFMMFVMEAFRGDFDAEENQRKLRRVVENAGVVPGVTSIYVLDHSGKVVAHGGPDSGDGTIPAALIAYARDVLHAENTVRKLERTPDSHHFIIARPLLGGIYDPLQRNGVQAGVIITFDLSAEDRLVTSNVNRIAAFQIAAAILAAFFLYLILTWRMVRPLASLNEAVQEVGASNFAKRARVHRSDEFGEIAQTFNRMMDRLNTVMVSRDELEKINTQLVQTQALMIQSSKMASLGEMAAGIAHEINNPLTIIHGKASIIASRAVAGEISFPEVVIEAEKIKDTSNRIAKIIRSLRSFARQGENDPFEVCSLRKVVDETLELCKQQIAHSGIQLELESISPELSFECRGSQISQVILNCLSNSSDAIQDLPEKWIRLSAKAESGWIELRITDSGRGISKELQQKIFQPFFTTKEIGKGTGMGLSISKGILESQSGEFFVDSDSPNTCFVIRMPCTQERKSV